MSRSSNASKGGAVDTPPLSGPFTAEDATAWRELRREVLDRGLQRWPLPVPWTEVGAVNCYLISDGGRVLLVDPGWSIPESRSTLDRYMRDVGLHYSDVTAMISTHHHADHITQAFDLRREFGTPLLAGRGEQESLQASMDEGVGFRAQLDMLRAFGGDELAELAAEYRSTSPEAGLPTGLADKWLDDGDVLDLIPSSPKVIGTPGHTRGHVSLRVATDRIISGDHILPMIPTSSGLERTPEEFPLRSYLTSLHKVLAQSDARLLPAHGHVKETVHRRAKALLGHHEARLIQVRRALEGGMSAAELASSLPWTKRRLRFEDLPVLRRISALMEIGVHLDELVLRDELKATRDRSGILRYGPTNREVP